jgi:hypothetical protein
MALNINDFDETEMVGHMESGNQPMIGIDAPNGFYTGKRLREAGQGVCGLLRWIKENSPWTIQLLMSFEEDGSKFWIRVVRQSDGAVIRQIGPRAIRGKGQTDIGFAERHEQLGYRFIVKFARRLETRLIEEGILSP